MTTLINLTPHQITLRTADNDVVIAPTAPAARVTSRPVPAGDIDGIPLVLTEFGPVENLPDPAEGVIYITSTMVAQRAARADVVSPDTGPTAIRENGQIVAVRALQVFA